MRLARPVFLAALTVALAAYGMDCFGMTTPEQAMQCCAAMQCSSHAHHGQDCCKTMPSMHGTVGQPSSVQGVSFSPVALGTVLALDDLQSSEPSVCLTAEHSHDPPSASTGILALRI